MTKFLVAPDKFKGSLSACEVATTIAEAIRGKHSGAEIQQIPIADGGDGSLEILYGNDYEQVPVRTFNALMEPIDTYYGLKTMGTQKIAFLEMASICGIASLKGRALQPYFATSYGLGDVASQVIATGVNEIIVSVGGSASTDGGVGFLVGLGGKVLDQFGLNISPNLAGLDDAASVDLTLLHSNVHPLTSSVKWTFLVDVNNPLVGKAGAAHVFGPQKGLRNDQLEEADQSLRHWSSILHSATGIDFADVEGAGAAGGVASVGKAIFGAQFISGSKWFADELKLDQAIELAEVVITGEGFFDQQSLMGKGPGYVIEKSMDSKKKVIVFAGQVAPELKIDQGFDAYSLVERAGSVNAALSDPKKWLSEIVKANI